jgi:glucose-1-phosphate thymidylyltransferase
MPPKDDVLWPSGGLKQFLKESLFKFAPTMKVLIPVAGAGTRLRPHTYTQPKPLIPVAGKPIISFIVDKMRDAGLTEFVFVIGYLGDRIRDYIEETYPDLSIEFVYQEHREGSGHAVWSAREVIEDEEELLIAFGDTIFETDMAALVANPHSCVGLKRVNDPRDFGVAECDGNGFLTKVVEKPKIPKSNLALVGLYKIKEVGLLLQAVDHLVKNDLRTVGEIQLTDALQYMLDQGCKIDGIPVTNWFDCGRKEVLLLTNATLLGQGAYASDAFNLPEYETTIIIHPVSIGKNCQIKNSIIGPDVTIGDHAEISDAIVKDSIIGNFSRLEGVLLRHSVIGSDAKIKGMDLSLNIGDNTEIDFD